MVNEVWPFAFSLNCHWIQDCDVNVIKDYINVYHTCLDSLTKGGRQHRSSGYRRGQGSCASPVLSDWVKRMSAVELMFVGLPATQFLVSMLKVQKLRDQLGTRITITWSGRNTHLVRTWAGIKKSKFFFKETPP